MGDMLGEASDSLRLPKPLIAAAIIVAAIGASVAYTRNGLDVLALALLILVIIIVERTIGDWFAELMGPAASIAVLGGVACFCVWQLIAGHGRETTFSFFLAAEHRGYRTLYLNQALDYSGRSVDRLRPTATTGGPVPSPSSSARASNPVPRSRIALTPSEAVKDSVGRKLSNLLVLRVPPEAQAGKTVSVSISLTDAASALRRGRVEILLDDRVAGTADIRADGTAVATMIAPRSGTHTVRARLTGVSGGEASTAATLIVRP